MTNKRWLKREEDFFARELKALNRHHEFIMFAKAKANSDIDWDCYWSWFYHSDCSCKEAFEKCFDE